MMDYKPIIALALSLISSDACAAENWGNLLRGWVTNQKSLRFRDKIEAGSDLVNGAGATVDDIKFLSGSLKNKEGTGTNPQAFHDFACSQDAAGCPLADKALKERQFFNTYNSGIIKASSGDYAAMKEGFQEIEDVQSRSSEYAHSKLSDTSVQAAVGSSKYLSAISNVFSFIDYSFNNIFNNEAGSKDKNGNMRYKILSISSSDQNTSLDEADNQCFNVNKRLSSVFSEFKISCDNGRYREDIADTSENEAILRAECYGSEQNINFNWNITEKATRDGENINLVQKIIVKNQWPGGQSSDNTSTTYILEPCAE